jgi:ribosomal protein S19E (S16A)
VSAITTRTFTVGMFAAAGSLARDEAEAYLEEFEATGVVERCAGGWALTPKGREIVGGLALCDDRDLNDNTNQHVEVTERSTGDLK